MLRPFLFYIICFLFCIDETFSSATLATPLTLSEQASVSVLTCGPGEQIYSVFGHTALRIADPTNGFDKVYNYGTFDFKTPNFALKFAKGNLPYFLSVSSFDGFIYTYQMENRSVSSQTLRLSHNEAQRLYNLLEENLQPSKKHYQYQFFSDNCTTRIYQLLAKSLSGKMKTDTSYIREEKSYRQLFNPYLKDFPWVKLGMNIGLGVETDQRISFVQSLFLPAMLEEALNHSTNNGQPLVATINSLFTPLPYEKESSFISLTPLLLLSILATITILISISEFIKKVSLPFLNKLVFGITGTVGVVLLLLWMFSLHTPTHRNLNLLWLMPLHLLFIFAPQGWWKAREYYIKVNLALLGLLFLLNLVIHLFVIEFYPVALIVMARLLTMQQAQLQTVSRNHL